MPESNPPNPSEDPKPSNDDRGNPTTVIPSIAARPEGLTDEEWAMIESRRGNQAPQLNPGSPALEFDAPGSDSGTTPRFDSAQGASTSNNRGKIIAIGIGAVVLLVGAVFVGVKTMGGDGPNAKPSAKSTVSTPRVVNGVEITAQTPLNQLPMISAFSKDGSIPSLKESGLTQEQYDVAVALDPVASPQTYNEIAKDATGREGDVGVLFEQSFQEGFSNKLLVDSTREITPAQITKQALEAAQLSIVLEGMNYVGREKLNTVGGVIDDKMLISEGDRARYLDSYRKTTVSETLLRNSLGPVTYPVNRPVDIFAMLQAQRKLDTEGYGPGSNFSNKPDLQAPLLKLINVNEKNISIAVLGEGSTGNLPYSKENMKNPSIINGTNLLMVPVTIVWGVPSNSGQTRSVFQGDVYLNVTPETKNDPTSPLHYQIAKFGS